MEAYGKYRESGNSMEQERLILEWLSDPISTLVVAAVVRLLSTHAEDEMYLTIPNPLISVSSTSACVCGMCIHAMIAGYQTAGS